MTSYVFFGLRSSANYSALIDVLIVFRIPMLLGPIILLLLGVSGKPPDFSMPGKVFPPVEGGESGGFSLVLRLLCSTLLFCAEPRPAVGWD